MIKTIIFDIGNVLLKFDHALAIQQVSKLTKIPTPQLQAHFLKSNNLGKYESGETSTDNLIEELHCLGSAPFEKEQFTTAISDIFTPIIQSNDLARRLKEAGYRITLLSNTCPAHWDFIEENYKIFEIFDDKTLSFEVGCCKPAADIFKDALAKAACEPHECFYTDDIAAYTSYAQEHVGFNTHTFTETHLFEKALEEQGVAIL